MTDYKKVIEIVDEQENLLRPDAFRYADALALGLRIIDLAKKEYAPVSVRVDVDSVTVFHHIMDGRGLGNDWWMEKKLNGSRKTGRSSFMNFLTIQGEERKNHPWIEDEDSFAARGGCFPICLKDGQPRGYVMVSGLKHQEDHQLIADALGLFLGVPVPTVLDEAAGK